MGYSLDVGLIVTSIVFAVLIIIASLYFVTYFQNPEDKWVAWFPKFIVILGLSLAAYNIFLLPFDVSMQKSSAYTPQNSPMEFITVSFSLTTVILVLIVIPFVVFWYEGLDEEDDPEGKKTGSNLKQIKYVVKFLLPIYAVVGIGFGILTWQFAKADIPIKVINAPNFLPRKPYTMDYFKSFCVSATGAFVSFPSCFSPISDTVYNVPISPMVYLIALTSFLGWVIFSFFGGVGMVTLPLDLVSDFIHRPRPISQQEYEEKKKLIGQQAQILHDVGKDFTEEIKLSRHNKAQSGGFFSNGKKNILKREANFRRDVLILEIHYKRLEDSFKNQGGNFILQVAKLVFGVISGLISFLWFIHIILYTYPKILSDYIGFSIGGNNYIDGFLNNFFISISGVPVVGIFFYGLFAFHLLFCVIKGVVKIGMRIFFITLHPMAVGETMMNSLVFNTGVILVASLAVVQFLTISLKNYAQNSASSSMFGLQFQFIQGLNYAFTAAIFNFGFVMLVTGLYIMYNPYKKQKENRMNFKW